MATTATFRVKGKSGTLEARPERERLEQAADLLRQSGFSIRRIGRFGVSASGDDEAFERELGITPQPGKPLVAEVTPRTPPLAKLVDLIEITGQPEYFKG